MKRFVFAMAEAFWSAMVNAELFYGRARRRIESKWVLRKKENTQWGDVWRYLDKISGRTWHDGHIDRLKCLSDREHEAWQKKINAKYSVKL